MIYEGSRNCYIDQPAEFSSTLISFLNSLPVHDSESDWSLYFKIWVITNDSSLVYNIIVSSMPLTESNKLKLKLIDVNDQIRFNADCFDYANLFLCYVNLKLFRSAATI